LTETGREHKGLTVQPALMLQALAITTCNQWQS